MGLVIDLHVIQGFTNAHKLNADANGAPKTLKVGGQPRIAVSAQSWKYAIRRYGDFDEVDAKLLGDRTRNVLSHLMDMIALPEEEKELAAKALQEMISQVFGDFADKPRDGMVYNELKTNTFIAAEEYAELARLFTENKPQLLAAASAKKGEELVKAVKPLINEFNKRFVGRTSAIDIALFGRMVASNTGLNVDGAATVATTFTTHAATPDVDFYISMDWHGSISGEAQGGFLGDADYSPAAVYYRCGGVNINQLRENLDTPDQVNLAAATFVRNFINAIPGGGRRRYNSTFLPNYVLAVVYDASQHYNFGAAFEAPVANAGNGYVMPSVVALNKHFNTFCRRFNPRIVSAAAFVGMGIEEENVPALGIPEKVTRIEGLNDFITHLTDTIKVQ